MTDRTRSRLGAHFLFALLLLTLPVALAVVHFDAASKAKRWVRTAEGVELVKPTDRAEAVAFAQKTYGLSRSGAERVLAKRERETGQRIGMPDKLPMGAQLDYFEVDGTQVPQTARYKGSAVVVDPKSAGAAAAINYWRNSPELKKDAPEFLKFVKASLDQGFLLAPLGLVSSAPTSRNGLPDWKKEMAGTIGPAATTTNIRIAVICTKLPGLRDISPRSNGNTDPNDTGSLSINYDTGVPSVTPAEVCYRQATDSPPAPVGLLYNYASSNDVPAGGDEPYTENPSEFGSIFDSVGGTFNTGGTWGIPYGITSGAWDFTDEQRRPHSSHATNLLLQNDMYNLFFNPTFSVASVTNFFYQQTHGAIRVDGTTNDIVGWLTSAHQLNRYPYQIGGGNSLFVQPGTPIIRKVSAAGVNPAANQVVRATLSDSGLTILFSHPVPPGTFVMPALNVYTNSPVTTGDNGVLATSPTSFTTTTGGWVSINWSVSTETTQMDPYDSRRWTIVNTGGTAFKYQYVTGTTLTTAAWVPVTGAGWNLAYSGYTDTNGVVLTAPPIPTGYATIVPPGIAPPHAPPYYTYPNPGFVSQNQSTTHGNQRQGCPRLIDTDFTAADMRISLYNHSDLPYLPAGTTSTNFDNRPFARLLSEEYYITSFVPGQTHQIKHMRNQWGYDDDISGTTVPSTPDYRANRVYPFDHEKDDPWNGGYWGIGGAVRNGNSGVYAGDVNNVMLDNGIALSGYDRWVYIAADGGPSTPGGGEYTLSGFQPSSSLQNLNESGAGVAFHELAHTFGAGDLYDNDLYANHAVPPPVPLFHECYAMGKYSLMDAGGRLDALHQISMGYCTPQVITQDTLGVQIPQVESSLRDPVIIKIAGNPYYLKKGIAAAAWQEYFLLENRNLNSSDGNGAYGFDTSTKGLYIYHIDMRGMARNNPSQAGFQREDDLLSVIIEQADGLYELEFNDKGFGGQDFARDPFGANTLAKVTRFWQFPMFDGDINDSGLAVSLPAASAGSPTSFSHGYTNPEKLGNPAAPNVIVPGTETDSFARVLKISAIGDPMTADVYVEPAELRVTGTSIAPANVQQGAQDIGFLKVTMENREDTTVGKTDMSRMSTKDVYVDTLRILESGTSSNGTNLSAVKLYQDAAPENGVLDVPGDALLATGLVNTAPGPWQDYAVFTNLGYKVPLGQIRTLFIAYDVAPEAQTNPHITVGAEFSDASKILPRPPGTVEVRRRQDDLPNSDNAADMYNFGSFMFPVFSNTSVIVGYPDRLVITGDTTNMPTFASQGQAELPMLKLNCAVNPPSVAKPLGDPRAGGSVRVDSIKVDQISTANALSDLNNCKLYLDDGDGVFDYTSDTVLGTSSFTLAGALQQANFPNLNLTINAGTPLNLFLAVSVAPTADITKDLQLSLKFTTEGPQPQDTCYVQLINNPTELNANKDYVEFVDPDGIWPINSVLVNVIVPNQPPGAPQPPFDPSGGAMTSDTTPLMTWGAATDPDAGDPQSSLRYEIQIADNASFTSPVVSTITPAGQTQYQVLVDLIQGANYWWRVRAIDAQDATGPWSVVQTFQVVTNRPPDPIVNTPPPGFVPPNATTVTTLTPTLSWNPTTDPDASDTPNTLTYHLVVDDNNDYSTPNLDIYLAPVGGVAVTSRTIALADGLQWGTRYYWKVTARDVGGLEQTVYTPLFFTPVQDSAPYVPGSGNSPNIAGTNPPSKFDPANAMEVSTANPVLQWTMPNPPDVDPTDPLPTIHYIVQLKQGVPSSHSDMTEVSPGEVLYEKTTADDVRQWQVDHDDSIPAPTLNLEDNARYYWWVRAVDDEGLMSDWSAVQNFWVNLDNDPPNPPTSGFDPNNSEQISDSTPRIQWNHAVDPDPTDTFNFLHYVIELSPDNFATVAQQYTTGNGQNFADVTAALTDLTMWYYRVKTIDDEGAESGWSVVQQFYLDTGNQLPTLTNPACTPLYGDAATFFELAITYTDVENDMPDWVRVTITADSGDLTLDMAKLNPGDNNAVDGIRYVVGVSAAAVGLGAHWNYFTAGINRGAPPVPVEQARQPDVGSNRGPIVGTPSTTRFVTGLGTNVDATTYQEGFAVFVQVADPDEDDDSGAADSIPVVVSETAGDAEVVWLSETGNSTGIFEGTLPTLGRAGAVGDNVLNVRAGAAGNVITVRYTDEDDVQPPPNATPDTSQDTATVIDTVAPAVVPAPAVTSGPHGRTATVDWTGYDEPAQADVAGYHIYYRDAGSGGDFTDTTTPGLTMLTVPAGQFSRLVTGLTPGTQYWFAVGPFDEVPNETRTPVATTSVTTTDTSPPSISAQVPGVNATSVDRNTSISFNLDDPGIGIDQGSLVVTVTQNGNPVPISAPVIVGNIYTMQVTVTPTAPLLWNATVNVAVTVSDAWAPPNTLNTNWNFYTVTDFVAPTLDNQVPAPGATNVPVTTGVSFELHDATSGIDQSSVQLTFNGAPVPWGSLGFSPATNGYRVTYDPPGDLSYSSNYTVSVTAADMAGNVVGPVNWAFDTVVDNSSVVMDQFNPAQNATGVPIGTNVSLRLSDPQSGIQVPTFRMWVYGTEITGSPDLTIVQTPPAPATSASTMLVTYNPPADFPYATDIYVRVYVLDGVGNVADLTYKFTTTDAPTYIISGLIEDQDGLALPGVQVAAGAQTAMTDGNGAYRITGLLDGVYVVTPTRDQYDFAPVTRTVDVGPDDVTDADFIGTLRTYHLRGRVTEDAVGVPGVRVTAGTKFADTDANGNYDIAGLPNGTYTVTPTLVNNHFSPTTRAAQIIGADLDNVDFTAIADTFSISGTVRDNIGNRVDAVQVTCGTRVAVTNAAGQYLISGLRAGNYAVTPTKAGYLMSPLSQVVGVPPDQTAIDFTANIEMVTNVPAGTNLIGVPGLPTNTNPLNVFGAGNWVYRWNPNLSPPQWLVAQNNPNLEFVQVKAGRGFFVRFAGPTELRIAGVPTTGSVSIGLGEGWNMIANPRTMPTRFSSFVSSVPDGIRPYCFIYNNAIGSYELVSSEASVGALRDSLLGWEGAWVRAMNGGVSLLVSAGAASAEPVRPAQANLNGGWTIPIVARAGNRADVSSLAGVAPGSNDGLMVENPPTAPETVDVYFTDAAGVRLAHDIRSATASQVTFNFTVACNVPDAAVTLTLPDLSAVPRSQQVMLVDKTTGKSLYARTLPSYSYRSEGESSERQFQVVVQPHTIGALAVSAATAQATGNNVALTYTVTRTANVTIRVMNMAGRCIRLLAAEKPVVAGAQTELWNLQSESGTRVPAGTYLLQIEAVADNGQRVRGMTQVRVGR